ncbi:MAG: phenylacetate-CoA oxygenase subunit PaaI [Betaproteobacteria bacterium]|nr:MAG: phenylacetate-CoA oxygenase subunit PaaI [Betaproteobacteria bacterium]
MAATTLVFGVLPQADALRLADTCLLWAHRLSEWCGHGPAIEEDIALTNTALDAIGQARALYQAVALARGDGSSEDTLAYFRDPDEFCNLSIAAVANGDYAQTVLRSLYLSAWFISVWEGFAHTNAIELHRFAAESAKAARMCFRHASDWAVRFGDGTGESRARMERALLLLEPFVLELLDAELTGSPAQSRSGSFRQRIDACFAQATLSPLSVGSSRGSSAAERRALLTEMQSLARLHPTARW